MEFYNALISEKLKVFDGPIEAYLVKSNLEGWTLRAVTSPYYLVASEAALITALDGSLWGVWLLHACMWNYFGCRCYATSQSMAFCKGGFLLEPWNWSSHLLCYNWLMCCRSNSQVPFTLIYHSWFLFGKSNHIDFQCSLIQLLLWWNFDYIWFFPEDWSVMLSFELVVCWLFFPNLDVILGMLASVFPQNK